MTSVEELPLMEKWLIERWLKDLQEVYRFIYKIQVSKEVLTIKIYTGNKNYEIKIKECD